MAGKLLDYDPLSGVSEYYHKTDKGFAIQTVQDVEPVLDRNKRLMNEDSGHYRDGNYHHVASIPIVVLEQWRKELGDDPLAKHNRKWLIAKLNDRENMFMRTKGGTL
jgi:hypothetical protein